MSHTLLKRLIFLASFCIASACVAFAGLIVEPFPTAGDPFTSATNGNGTIPSGGQTNFQWTTGDSVTSSVFIIPGSSVTGLTENWQYQSYLQGGGSEAWNIYVNGVLVGAEVLNDCGSDCGGLDFGLTNTLSFAGIAPAAGGYQIGLILQNTVPSGLGSVAWLDGGTTVLAYASGVPEPSGLTALGLALLSGLAWVRRRGRR
ncbi:MAG: PEP-CTERM sorting domain-containing protein [Bryobacteraceae bacterium]|jgi:hypothetical protein